MKKLLLGSLLLVTIPSFAEVFVKKIDTLTEAGKIDALITFTGEEAQALYNSAGQAEGYQFVTSTVNGINRRSTVSGAEVICTQKIGDEQAVKCVVNIKD